MPTTQIVRFAVVAGIALASTVHAQQAATPVEKPAGLAESIVKHLEDGPTDPAQRAAVVADLLKRAEPAKAPPPVVLSDAEKAAIDVLSLIAQRDAALKDLGQCTASLVPLQAQAREAQLRARVDALRQVIEKSHQGYRWDIENGTLVAIPPKAAKAAAPKKD